MISTGLILLTALHPQGAALAWMLPTPEQEIALVTAALTALAGGWLCWTAPEHRMSAEEEVKDGHLTEAGLRRQVRLRAWLGPGMVLAGALASGWVMLGWIAAR